MVAWIAPLLAIAIGVVMKKPATESETMRYVATGLFLLLGALGLSCSLVAIATARRHGWVRQLVPGLIGLVLSSGIVHSFVLGLFFVPGLNQASNQQSNSNQQVNLFGTYYFCNPDRTEFAKLELLYESFRYTSQGSSSQECSGVYTARSTRTGVSIRLKILSVDDEDVYRVGQVIRMTGTPYKAQDSRRGGDKKWHITDHLNRRSLGEEDAKELVMLFG